MKLPMIPQPPNIRTHERRPAPGAEHLDPAVEPYVGTTRVRIGPASGHVTPLQAGEPRAQLVRPAIHRSRSSKLLDLSGRGHRVAVHDLPVDRNLEVRELGSDVRPETVDVRRDSLSRAD